MDTPNQKRLSRVLVCFSVGLVLIVLGSFLSRTVNPLPSTKVSPIALAGTYLALLALAGGCVGGSRRVVTSQPGHAGSQTPSAAEVVDRPTDPTHALPALPPAVAGHPFIRRLRAVLDNYGGDTHVAGDLLECVDDEYRRFAVRTAKPGLFAQEKTRTHLFQLISKSVGGHWTMRENTEADILVFERKAGFPKVVTPPVPERIAKSIADALDIYQQFRIMLGVTANCTVLKIDPAKFPHMIIVGGTGSGKSVFNRAMLELFRTSGWIIFLGDGKGTDYEGLHRQPNIVAISQGTADHVRLVRMVADELRARQSDAKKNKRRGAGNPFTRPPLLLLLDEFATMKADVLSVYGSEQQFMEDLLFLTRVGREFKVHVAIATQELYRSTLPGTLLGNMNLIVSLGPPADKTIREAFPDALKAEAERIGGTISKNDRGRGIALFSGEDGKNEVVEFQSYYGYSPAESKMPPDPDVAAAWQQYKDQASDQVPKMYPRAWFAMEGPDYGATAEDLYALPTVSLDGPDGRPNLEMVKFDPLHDTYLGAEDDTGGSVIRALEEMPLHPPQVVEFRKPDVHEPPTIAVVGDDDFDDPEEIAAAELHEPDDVEPDPEVVEPDPEEVEAGPPPESVALEEHSPVTPAPIKRRHLRVKNW
ncbi:hypothetical protein EEB14_22960 [Rhodococcus sp. WS4]|nr:hypothetical protein EEB14_22960 [Rhodococcus sp. WS4]